MPFQHAPREAARLTQGQNAFLAAKPRRTVEKIRTDIFIIPFLVVLLIRHYAIKERRRRKLFFVPNDDDLIRPRDRAKRVLRADLRRLVDNQQIKRNRRRRQELRHRYRAHQQHRLDALDGCAGSFKQLAQRNMTTVPADLATNDPHLAHGTLRHLREVSGQH